MTDYDRVLRCKNGDKSMYLYFYQKYEGYVVTFKNSLYSLRYEDREDFEQDAYIEIHKLIDYIDIKKINQSFQIKSWIWKKMISLRKKYLKNSTYNYSAFRISYTYHPKKQSHQRTMRIHQETTDDRDVDLFNYCSKVESYTSKRYWVDDYDKLQRVIENYLKNLPPLKRIYIELKSRGFTNKQALKVVHRGQTRVHEHIKPRRKELQDIIESECLLNIYRGE